MTVSPAVWFEEESTNALQDAFIHQNNAHNSLEKYLLPVGQKVLYNRSVTHKLLPVGHKQQQDKISKFS